MPLLIHINRPPHRAVAEILDGNAVCKCDDNRIRKHRIGLLKIVANLADVCRDLGALEPTKLALRVASNPLDRGKAENVASRCREAEHLVLTTLLRTDGGVSH
jgi:hypothetical protein